MLTYEVYRDKRNERNEWRWRLKAENGNTIADSGEGYINKSDCLHGIELVKSSATAPIQQPVSLVKVVKRVKAIRTAARQANFK
jgi:uncharacterized protein